MLWLLFLPPLISLLSISFIIQELLGSFHSKCHVSKEVVNAELADFSSDLVEIIENNPFSETKCKIEDLLLQAQNCMEMSCNEFRKTCEGIVQELMNQRLQCQDEDLRQILTRMLFILTRCTRLLQFQKDCGAINEDSLLKFRVCLDSIPVVESGWPLKPVKVKIRFLPILVFLLDWFWFPIFIEFQIELDSTETPYKQLKDSLPEQDQIKSVLFSDEKQDEPSELDSVICRICEEYVPTSNLESHSYICAYADKCDLEGTTIDDRLAKMSEILEQIFDSYAHKVDGSYESSDSVNRFSNRSAKVLEWHNKGLEGMIEDLHEMDTAFLDESQLSNFSNLKGHPGIKVGSSNGSMTPGSSTSTPRANCFDLFWLDHRNPSHLEDANQVCHFISILSHFLILFEPKYIYQIKKLAEIARRTEEIDFKMEGALEISDACMHHLESILYHSKVKALIVDTFGTRLRNLWRQVFHSCSLLLKI